MEFARLPAEARRRRKEEIRAFLRSRRARVAPGDVGFPEVPGRRTPGLRREEVAVMAGVGVSWYTWLEQGREINVSPEVLDAIARVLRLDPAEREHLHLLAGLNPPRATAPAGRSVPDGVRRVIEGWMPRPAYAVDRHWNMIAVNRAAREVFGYEEDHHNCLVGFFTDPRLRSSYQRWREGARAVVGQFRADAARYPDDPEFDRLLTEMRALSPEFAELWDERHVGGAPQGVKGIDHPEAGELVFEYTSLPLTDLPGHRLILHTPVGETAARLAALLKVVVADPGPAGSLTGT